MNNENEEVKVEAEEKEETSEDTKKEAPKVEKPKRTPEEELEYFEGRAKRLRKQLGKDKEQDEEEPAPKPKSGSNKFEYGELAFLKAYGVEGSDELQLVRQYLASGKSLEDIVKHKLFISDLADLRDAKAAQEAIPSGSKRSSTPARDSVEYWIGKGELPPNTPENQQLRRDVVNAREKRARDGSKFSDVPVVG